jgi:hypothetical protein
MLEWIFWSGLIGAVVIDVTMHYARWRNKKEKLRKRLNQQIRKMLPGPTWNNYVPGYNQVKVQPGSYFFHGGLNVDLPRGGHGKLRLYDVIQGQTLVIGSTIMHSGGEGSLGVMLTINGSLTVRQPTVVELQTIGSSGFSYKIGKRSYSINTQTWATVDPVSLVFNKIK